MTAKLRAELRVYAELLRAVEMSLVNAEEEKSRPRVNGAAGS